VPQRKKPRKRKPSAREDSELKEIYAKYKKEFSAADLQKYTEIEEGIPVEQVIAEMAEIHRKYAGKRGS
jgi:hypothetical protein